MSGKKTSVKKSKVQWDIREFSITEIHPAEYNPRSISDKALAGLSASIEKFGCVEPIIINIRDGKNVIVGGHQRFKVLVSAGIETVVCVAVDLNEADEKLLNLSLNNPETQGEFTEQISMHIQELIDELGDSSDIIDLKIDMLQEQVEETNEGLVDDDNVPDIIEETETSEGDAWQLGDHLLICGDCTTELVYEKLKVRANVDLVFTDPPYNMNYQSKPLGGIKNDHMAEAAFVGFILKSVAVIKDILRGGGSYYICMSAAEYPTVCHQLRKLGLKGRQIIWCKPSLGMGAQEYRPRFEVMLYGYVGKRKDRTWNGQRHHSDLWEFSTERGVIARQVEGGTVVEVGNGVETWQIFLEGKAKGSVIHFDGSIDDLWKVNRASGTYVHPTQKPVALIERAILNSSNKGDIVCDLFGGSGSTLIACEKTNRPAG